VPFLVVYRELSEHNPLMFADARHYTCIVYHHLLTGDNHIEAFAQRGICTQDNLHTFMSSRVLAVD